MSEKWHFELVEFPKVVMLQKRMAPSSAAAFNCTKGPCNGALTPQTRDALTLERMLMMTQSDGKLTALSQMTDIQNEDTEALTSLGLTTLQATVYLHLVETEKAKIKEIDKKIGSLEIGFTKKFFEKEKLTTSLLILFFGFLVFIIVIGLS